MANPKELEKAIQAEELGDIRSILDELYPNPSHEDALKIAARINSRIQGGTFYFGSDGWYYEELEQAV